MAAIAAVLRSGPVRKFLRALGSRGRADEDLGWTDLGEDLEVETSGPESSFAVSLPTAPEQTPVRGPRALPRRASREARPVLATRIEGTRLGDARRGCAARVCDARAVIPR